MDRIETPMFPSTSALVAWMRHARKMERYQVVPTRSTTVFADGYEVPATFGKKGGTVAASFDFMVSTLTGKLLHKGDNALGEEIDRRKVVLDEPIRNLGEHTVTVHLIGRLRPAITVVAVGDAEYQAAVAAAQAEAKAAEPAEATETEEEQA